MTRKKKDAPPPVPAGGPAVAMARVEQSLAATVPLEALLAKIEDPALRAGLQAAIAGMASTAAAEWVPVESLTPWAQNPRKNADAVPGVAKSIERFGWGSPILARRADRVIIAGDTRFKAALLLKMDKVPVRFLDLDPDQSRLLAIADNKLGELAEWDDDKLSDILQELYEKGAGDALDDLGFDEKELDALLDLDGARDGEGGEDPGADETPKVAVSKPGEVYQLGPHRIMCGNSRKLEDVLKLMNGRKAALCATDPPYLVDYTGERPDDTGKDWTDVYHEIEIKDADQFFRDVFRNVLEVIAPHSAIYCWHAHKRVVDIVLAWRELGILDHQQIIWVKPTPVYGRVFWHFRHEPCIMGWRQGSIPAHDGDQSIDSVWEIDWEGKSRVVGNEHPTQKPLEIFARPIRKHTRKGDIVYEPFSGSGSQLIAAAKEGRVCYAMEIEPVFVDVARRRWTKYARSLGIDPGPGALDLTADEAAEEEEATRLNEEEEPAK